jgi:hypothetical protein
MAIPEVRSAHGSTKQLNKANKRITVSTVDKTKLIVSALSQNIHETVDGQKRRNLRCLGASRKRTTNMKIFSRHMQTVTVFLPYMVVDEKRKQVFSRSYTSPKDGGVVSLWGGFVEANSPGGREMDARSLSRRDTASCSRTTRVLDQ